DPERSQDHVAVCQKRKQGQEERRATGEVIERKETPSGQARVSMDLQQSPIQVNKKHFNTSNLVLSTDLCVRAKVAIGGINYVPELGLYNGARGEIVDIVYKTMAGPNNKHEDHLPAYVVVDFPHLRLPPYIEPWDRLHPTVRLFQSRFLINTMALIDCLPPKHVPVPTRRVDCTYNRGDPCCTVRYCPLVLAWATTIHKFQGYEAGFEETDTVNRLIINPGDHSTEMDNPGMFYVAASRGKTFGKPTAEEPYPKDSAVYWNGPVSTQSIQTVKYKQNGDVCVLVQKRDEWVEYLYDRAEETKRRCNEEWKRQATARVKTAIEEEPLGQHNLDNKIIGMMRQRNEKWSDRRKAEYMVPAGYFNS
ncbi:hypothetical protein THAOC_15666, partial [Thalassiosira oceanica]